jgi:hypothetical protein
VFNTVELSPRKLQQHAPAPADTALRRMSVEAGSDLRAERLARRLPLREIAGRARIATSTLHRIDFRDGDNHLINKRAGNIIYSDTFDADGNPVSFTFDIVGGPHPFAEGGIFCDSAEKAFG